MIIVRLLPYYVCTSRLLASLLHSETDDVIVDCTFTYMHACYCKFHAYMYTVYWTNKLLLLDFTAQVQISVRKTLLNLFPLGTVERWKEMDHMITRLRCDVAAFPFNKEQRSRIRHFMTQDRFYFTFFVFVSIPI